jgi:hypothetical protein|tara:strand:- start:1746 stop:1928 length:183 start_codon:yes stop_codon:yes gene_type:complete
MAKGFSVKPNQPELYKIEEECTTGWEEYKTNLTKEEAKQVYDFLINEGYAPYRIKLTRIQ